MNIQISIKPFLAILTALVFPLLVSCQEDLLVSNNGGILKSGLNLSVSTLGAGHDVPTTQQPGSRAVVTDPAILVGTAAERTVKSLDLFLFADDGAMLAYKRLTESDSSIGGVSSTFPATSSGAVANININTLVNEGNFGVRRLAVVANWDDAVMGYNPYDYVREYGNSFSTLEQMIIYYSSYAVLGGNQTYPYSAPGLIMYGKSDLVSVEDVYDAPAFNVQLKRVAARLDLNLSVSGVMASAEAVAEVRVMQAANMAFLAPPTVSDGMSTMPSGTRQAMKATGLFASSPINGGAGSFSKTIYLPENNLRSGTYTRDNATYILVNIPLNGTNNWYRFWVNEADNRTPGTNNYHITRNTLYQITANIKVKGGASFSDAVETQDAHFDDVFYTLNYDVQPGMTGAPAIQRYRLGERVAIANITDVGAPGRDIYPVVFNTSAEETGTIYYPNDSITISTNTTLYARLCPTAPRITLDSSGKLAITYDARDLGLHFMWGSVVGIRNNGVNGDPFDASDVVFNPTGRTFTSTTDIPYATELADIDYAYQTSARVLAGKGDPCRLVGLTQADIAAGKFDNGTWRMPSNNENITLYNGWVYDLSRNELSSGGQGVKHTYPTVGWRNGTTGLIMEVGYAGNAWSSTYLDAQLIRHFHFTPGEVGQINATRDNATSVRCVRQGVPRITIATGSDGQPMLTLTDDPTDGGLLFNFGSTVGIYSGNHAIHDTRLPITDTFDAGDVAFDSRMDGWRPNIIQAYGEVPYDTDAATIDKGYHTVDRVRKEGKGDPCRLVGLTLTQVRGGTNDNGTWRLPTRAEVNALFGSEATGGTWENWSKAASPWGVQGWETPARNRNFKKFLPETPNKQAHTFNGNHWWFSQSPILHRLGVDIYTGTTLPAGDDLLNAMFTGRICVRQQPGE